MLVKVILVDVNPKMVAAWRSSFEENPEVDIIAGSMLEQPACAWVSPTNARGSMDGGLDAVIKKHLGPKIEKRLQKAIKRQYGGRLPLGHALCTETASVQPRYLISTPTMLGSSDDVSDTLNVALAAAAALQAVNQQNDREPGSIRAVALPGLGANTGRVPAEICADLMWTGYNLFRDESFGSFAELRKVLEQQLGDLTPMSGKVPVINTSGSAKKEAAAAQPVSAGHSHSHMAAAAAPAVDEDFDDFD